MTVIAKSKVDAKVQPLSSTFTFSSACLSLTVAFSHLLVLEHKPVLAQPHIVVGLLLDRTTDTRPWYRCGMLIDYPYEKSVLLSPKVNLQAQESIKIAEDRC